MIKKFLFYISVFSVVLSATFLSTGCNDAATVPAFIRIDTIIVDSTNYNYTGPVAPKVEFAWVYLDDNLQGVYTLPCKFPVIAEGTHKITVYGGVYEFGNSNSATRYIFYKPFISDHLDTLTVEDTLVLHPHVQYLDSTAVFPIKMDFDGIAGDFVYLGGSGFYSNNHNGGFTGDCLIMGMGPADTTSFSVISSNVAYIPPNQDGYFIELNYKCNCPFYFDIKTDLGGRSIVGFNTKNTWNKAYINITYAIDVTPGDNVQLVFKMFRDATIPNQEVLIDNIKLIYL
jgi:hypothetical protein